MLAAVNCIFTYLFIAKPKTGKFLKSFGEMKRGFDVWWGHGRDGEAPIMEKRWSNQKELKLFIQLLTVVSSMSARVWWRWNRCAKTRIYTQTYTPYLPFTIPCGSSALFADCYGWSLTALYGSALSSTPLLCLTLWPLAWGLRVMSFRSGSSSLVTRCFKAAGLFLFNSSVLVKRGAVRLWRLTGVGGLWRSIVSSAFLLLREAPGLKLFSCLCCPLVTKNETSTSEVIERPLTNTFN